MVGAPIVFWFVINTAFFKLALRRPDELRLSLTHEVRLRLARGFIVSTGASVEHFSTGGGGECHDGPQALRADQPRTQWPHGGLR
jgi:hypothetical protein